LNPLQECPTSVLPGADPAGLPVLLEMKPVVLRPAAIRQNPAIHHGGTTEAGQSVRSRGRSTDQEGECRHALCSGGGVKVLPTAVGWVLEGSEQSEALLVLVVALLGGRDGVVNDAEEEGGVLPVPVGVGPDGDGGGGGLADEGAEEVGAAHGAEARLSSDES